MYLAIDTISTGMFRHPRELQAEYDTLLDGADNFTGSARPILQRALLFDMCFSIDLQTSQQSGIKYEHRLKGNELQSKPRNGQLKVSWVHRSPKAS